MSAEPEAAESDPPGSTPPLTAEDRRRNVERVLRVESELERLETMVLAHIYQGAAVMRVIHESRQALREVFGKPPAPDLPPLMLAAEQLAGQIVIHKPKKEKTS